MVMEFASLGSLYEYLKSNTNMTWETKIKALHDISMGLNHLHDSNLIHQDLHPGNLLFSSNAGEDFLNIADLGLCRPSNQGLRPRIPYNVPRFITKLIMQCWDARPDKRPTSKVLYQKIKEWYYDIRRNRKSEFTAQIENAEKTSEHSSTYDALAEPHYKSHPNAIYSSRLLNFTNLSPPVNDSSFDEQLEKLLEDENDSEFVIRF
ncbi:10544_t:CDS:2 [Dentiscutata heterogama]|uniref:10544_t:CDS:1 n=1 Tax=Dentiscutata heterogama TaxID=1316150 RepID=A0ACA9L8U5_9GLOM|nr:10544_t:CDS:2 [Dentiscutata heterogama]